MDGPAIHAGGVPAYGQRLSPARRALVEECVVANVSGQHGQPGTSNQRRVALRVRARRRNGVSVPDHDMHGNVDRTQAALRKSTAESGRDCEYGFDASILVRGAGAAQRLTDDCGSPFIKGMRTEPVRSDPATVFCPSSLRRVSNDSRVTSRPESPSGGRRNRRLELVTNRSSEGQIKQSRSGTELICTVLIATMEVRADFGRARATSELCSCGTGAARLCLGTLHIGRLHTCSVPS